MQTTRRNFLKGLLSSVAAGALIKNGILQPEQVIAEPKRRVFDMGANTWRESRPISSILKWMPPLRPLWPMVGFGYYDIAISVSAAAVIEDIPVPRVGDLVRATFTIGRQNVVLGRVSRVSEVEGVAWVKLQSPGAAPMRPIWTLN